MQDGEGCGHVMFLINSNQAHSIMEVAHSKKYTTWGVQSKANFATNTMWTGFAKQKNHRNVVSQVKRNSIAKLRTKRQNNAMQKLSAQVCWPQQKIYHNSSSSNRPSSNHDPHLGSQRSTQSIFSMALFKHPAQNFEKNIFTSKKKREKTTMKKPVSPRFATSVKVAKQPIKQTSNPPSTSISS